MSGGRVIFVFGLFIVPLTLVWYGHHLRRRSPNQRAIFWGGVIGYGIGVVITSVFMLVPPVDWAGGGRIREMAIQYSMVVLALLGIVSAVATRWRHRPPHR